MTILADLRFAVRLLWKDRWFAAAAITALALGLGVNTTVFTFVNAVLLRGLPFPEPHTIVRVESQRLIDDRDLMGVSHADLQDWQRAATSFEGLAAWTGSAMNVSEAGLLPERFRGSLITANTFRMLRQPPLLGRDFTADDAKPGAPGVLMLGYAAWQDRYGGDPSVIGRVVRVNEVPATIVGVMPEGIKFPQSADMWQVLTPAPEEARDRRRMGAWGRIKSDVPRTQAEAELATIGRALAAQFPDTNKNVTVSLRDFTRQSAGQVRTMFLSLMGAVTFVLLIACANVANLLLSRSLQRAREVALRLALGASRWRVLRQLLVESLVLALLGAAGGLLLAWIGVRMFDRAVTDPGKPFWIVFTMDWTVFAYLTGVAILTGLIVGLAPAWQVSRASVQAVLKDGARGQVGGTRGRRFSSALVVLQIAMTLILLTGAGLMVRSFLALYGQDPGIETRAILTMYLNLAERKYPDAQARVRFFERFATSVAELPGAAAITYASHAPHSGSMGRTIEIDGQRLASGDRPPVVSTVLIGERYFPTLNLALLRGRELTAHDGAPGSEAIVVNERFVARFFRGEDPIGRRVRFIRDTQPGPWSTIVGVSPTIRQSAFREIEPDAVVYVPFRQEPEGGAVILARGQADPTLLATPLRQAMQALDPDLPVFSVRTLDTALAESRWVHRVFGTMFALFAVIALVLSAVGIYAVMAYAVTQRRQEIGIRMALGADAGAVTFGVLRGGLLQLALGAALGLAGAYAISGVLTVIVARTSPTDPLTTVSMLLLLVVVTVAACLVPARRAARVDPLVALRSE